MTDPKILALPACTELARGMADALRDVAPDYIEGPLIDAFMLLLSDLDRPESRDAWIRRLRLTWDTDPMSLACLAGLRDNPAALRTAILEATDA